jgi:histidinol dehydrogenase
VAGVGRIAMVTPPGRLEPAVLAAAQVAGVDEIWRVGGAQAVAALAYGAGPIRPVDKIVGPGNAYVSAAKRRLYGVVGIDALAGPSEIVVVADADNDPALIAADLLSQAEHDPDAQSVLITDDEVFARAVVAALDLQLETLATAEAARASWAANGAVVIAPLADSPGLVDRLAPEHVESPPPRPRRCPIGCATRGDLPRSPSRLRRSATTWPAPTTCLPTSRAARFSSGLSVSDFLKRTSIVRCDARAFAALGPATVTLATAEGLPAHAASAAMRLSAGA